MPATFVWDERLAAYDFGPGHPLAPVRVELAVRLARDLGLLDPDLVRETPADTATDDELCLVHDAEYVAVVRRLSDDPRPGATDLGHGLGTPDDPVFGGMHEASAHVVGASLAAVRAVLAGESEHAVNLAGGLHHAMRRSASGFCIYNDAAVVVQWALDAGVERIAYVDVDVHHGDGVERAFWDDPRVLTVSLHESPHTLFPGTGFPTDVGGHGAEGTAVNVALPPGTGDDGWLRAFDSVVPALLAAFRPALLVTQHGCDSHFLDPLAHLTLTVDGQRTSYSALHALAHEHANGRWVALGGGGYEHVEVVPRAWAHLVGEVVHRPVEPATAVPETWREYVLARLGRGSPGRMTDGRTPELRRWSSGSDPDGDLLDRAVEATRRAVFPLHGLDPARDL
ncbi:MAG: acetoin utilization protein AcuC [Actinomycetes bacterium]